MTTVLVVDTGYEEIDSALEKVFERFPLDANGKTVLVKPNMLGPYPPESHVNTNPLVVKGIVDRLKASGAEVSVGDNTGTQGYGAVEKSARVSGIRDAAGDSFVNLSAEIEKVELPGRNITVNVSKKVLECDLLISVPKFKTHTFTRITGAVKNSFGFLVGGDKARLHVEFRGYREFSELLVDVYLIRVPDLVVMDGVVCIQGNGPSNKDLYHAGKLLASDDGVCLDRVMTKMMRMRPENVVMLAEASRRGLGEVDPARIFVEGDAEPLPRFRRPVPGIPQLFGGAWISAFFPDIGRPRFDVDPGLCDSCSSCCDACPGGAITMEGGRPRFEHEDCISCYCCMELCPNQAISMRDTLRTRIYRWMGYLDGG